MFVLGRLLIKPPPQSGALPNGAVFLLFAYTNYSIVCLSLMRFCRAMA